MVNAVGSSFTPFNPIGPGQWSPMPWSPGTNAGEIRPLPFYPGMSDSFGVQPMGGAQNDMLAGMMQMVLEQALLGLLIAYFEQMGGRSQDAGSLGGSPGGGNMTPTSWNPRSSGGGSAPRASSGGGGGLTNVDTSAPASLSQLPQGDRSVGRFLNAALAQNGDEYEYGAGRNLNDANPHEFDCSGLVYWACNQAGINPNTIGGYSGAQAANTKHISVDEALRTPGALLFKPGHVAISLGDGRTIEAMGEKWGVRTANANGRGWTSGGLIPGMDYGGSIGVA